jgi:hypothetical protein
MYKVKECSPDDQIPPKLFVSIKSTDIYISSDKFVLDRSISMEVRFNRRVPAHSDFFITRGSAAEVRRGGAPIAQILKN